MKNCKHKWEVIGTKKLIAFFPPREITVTKFFCQKCLEIEEREYDPLDN